MINAYQAIMAHKKGSWESFFEKHPFDDVFEELVKEFPDDGDLTAVIHYILMAYSIESEMIIIGADWAKTKKKIFEKVMVKPTAEMYDGLVHLKSEAVQKTVIKWLDFQSSEVFEILQTAKDLRAELQLSCTTAIQKPDGEINYDQKYKNLGYCIELRKTIRELESELVQNSESLKDAVREVRQIVSHSKSFGVESFLNE